MAPLRALTTTVTCALAWAVPAGAQQLEALPPDPFPLANEVAPANVRPVLFGNAPAEATFVHVEDDDGSETDVPFVRVAPELGGETAFLLEPPELPQGEQLVVRCNGCDLGGTWPRSNVRDDVPPAFLDGEAVVRASGFNYQSLLVTHYSVQVTLPPIDEPFVMRFVGDEVDEVIAQFSDTFEFAFNVEGREPRTTCFRAIARDVAGNETELPDELCAVLDPAVRNGGCSQVGAPALAPVFAVALAFRRRRR